ncbi:MAG: NAD(P)-dependent oxidoreductase [Patescibacteria group bacterium]
MAQFDFEKVLTIGASGMIGSYVDFGMRPGHAECDITDEESVARYVARSRPSTILYLAGATDMVRAESEPAYAYALNVQGTHAVARAAREAGATMVYVSTSRVFRGDKEVPYSEEDTPDPETHYGMTKYAGELITAATVPEYIIARTSWVFGGGPKRDNKFYGKVLKQLQSGVPEIVALADVQGSPTYAKDFISTIKDLLARGERGVFHIANAGVATRFELAKAMTAQVHSSIPVRGVDRSFFQSGSTLPANESISSQRCALRPWQEALWEYIDTEWISAFPSKT